MVVLAVNEEEKQLIRDIDALGHGYIFDIELRPVKFALSSMRVHETVYDMILALRQNQKFDRLTIADGLPRYAEIYGESSSGRRYMQKLKF